MTAVLPRRGRVAAIAAAVTLVMLLGASAGWAYWTTQSTVQVTASSADLTVSTANFGSLATTFANHAQSHTGSVTVTNSTTSSSTQTGRVSLTFSAPGAPATASNFPYTVWESTAANPCTAAATPGTELASGTWGDGPIASDVQRLQSYNHPDRFIRHINTDNARLDANVIPAEDAHVRVVPGLFNSDLVSFQLVKDGNRYLRHFNYTLWWQSGTAEIFLRDSTFRPVPGLADPSWVSFESENYPGHYIRHNADGTLRISQISAGEQADATFRLVPGDSSTYVTPDDREFAPGESRTYCVRTTTGRANENWPANGAVSFTPRIDATITLGNYSGAATATAGQQTQYIFPLHSPSTTTTHWYYVQRAPHTTGAQHCMDRYAETPPVVGGWVCKDTGTGNQAWGFAPVTGKPGYFTIRTNLSNAQVIQVNGTGLTTAAVSASNANQHWTLQRTQANYTAGSQTRHFYQFVNDATGQCLTYSYPAGSGAHMAMANCNGTASQQFLVVRALFSGENGATSTVQCSYSNPNYTFAVTAGAPNMRYEVRVANASGTMVEVGSFTTNPSGTGSASIARGTVVGTNNTTRVLELHEDVGAGDPGTRVANGTVFRGGNANNGNNTCSLTGMGT